MATVYLDPLKLETKIIQLETFCANARTAANFDIKSQYKNDPVKSGGGLSPHITAIVNAAYVLDGRAVEIRANKTKIQQLSSNGLAITEGQGRIRLEVPDDSDALNDSSKFQKWAQASLDVVDLKKAEEARDVNKQNEIIQRIEQNKTDHTYAATFVDRYGVENVILLPGRAGSAEPGRSIENTLPDPKLTALSGSLLSYASQTWGSEKSKQISDRIRGWLKESHTPGRATRLNSVLSVSDAQYGKTFLVTLGDTLDDDPWDAHSDDPEVRAGSDSTGETLYGYSTDPLFGVVNAMKNNPEAATEYLVPEKNITGRRPDDMTMRADIKKRITEILDRHKAGVVNQNDPIHQAWVDTWSSLMAKTSSMYSGKDGTSVDQDAAARAALLSSAGIGWVSGESDLSSSSRSDLATVLKNYAYSVDDAASMGPYEDPVVVNPAIDDVGLQGVPPQAAFDPDQLRRVIGKISKNDQDYAKVVEGVGILNGIRMRYANSEGNKMTPNKIVDHVSASRGFLIGSVHGENEKNAADKDANNERAVRLVMGLTSFIPGLGEGVGELTKSSISYLQAQAESEVGDAARSTYVNNLAKEKENSFDAVNRGERYLNADIVRMMVNYNIYTPEEIENIKKRYPDIDFSKEISAKDTGVVSQLSEKKRVGSVLTPNERTKEIFDDAHANYETAYEKGKGPQQQ
ncbi:DUF6571 family protein [Actinomyces oris]|uniref:DUF6571 family protein n=1 Tax=Actinomyces oris TaxID=544580 RepID=UPI000A6F9DDC|nr:DUF6571 family protein [Actinomyces oris]